jgi:tetratricopeptide (TPR) repeat protein
MGLPYLEKRGEANPEDEKLQLNLAKLYSNLGMIAKSKEAFKRADEIISGLEGVTLGMSQDDVVKKWGPPDSKSEVNDANGKYEDWKYTSKHTFKSADLYFTGGVVKRWYVGR